MLPRLAYIETDIVNYCNLNCAGCSHFAPLVVDKFAVAVVDYERQLKRIGELFPYPLLFRVMGGEPLLHPELAKILDITRQYLPDAQIELVTNGILLRQVSQEVVAAINTNKVRVNISNYNLDLDLDYIKDTFESVCMVDRESFMYNICLNEAPSDSYIENYFNCASHRVCNYLKDGKLYHCAITGCVELFDARFGTSFGAKMLDGIDIYSNNHDDICDYLRTPISACKYCTLSAQKATEHLNYQSQLEKNEWLKPQ